MQSNKSTIRLMVGASLMAMTVGMAPGFAHAQSADTAVADETVSELIVVGARAAERSAIDRKKRAATVSDSIVADDIGQFPDKSASEAIARIAGVALNVADSGEAEGFTIRGQAADLIRIEVDGMTTLSNAGDQGGRSAQLNELSSDLIKSVDVIKGQTADMTPGGVGGTVKIETRNGLDFKKPLYQLNLQAQNSSLNSEWTPRISGVFARQFLDGRLGVLVNATYDRSEATQDFARISDGNLGYLLMGDHDGSPEKTFTTPYDPIAAAITTEAGCLALPTTGINSRLNCLAQWEDYVPSRVRYGRGYRKDTKFSAQLRLDFRVNDNLTVFASYNPNLRDYISDDHNLQFSALPRAITGDFTTSPTGDPLTNFRALSVNDNHYITEFAFVRTGAAGPGTGPTVSNISIDNQTREIVRRQESIYYQTGADFDWGKWTGKARLQYSTAKFEKEDGVFSLVAPLDSLTFSMIPGTGVWTYDAVARGGVDLTSPAAYYPLVDATTGISPNSRYQYIPSADKSNELAYNLDMVRKFDGEAGIFTAFKWGIQRREFENRTWREGGAFNLGSGVTQSRAQAFDDFRVCEPRTGRPACVYGSPMTVPMENVANQLYKTHTITAAQYNSVIDASLKQLPGRAFFGDTEGGTGLVDSWTTFDLRKFRESMGQYADLSDWNMDCLYYCIASDGKTYKHNSYGASEKTTSAYAMLDFESEVFGMGLFGNVGVRMQQIDVEAQTVLSINNRTARPGLVGTAPNQRPGLVQTDTVVGVKETNVSLSSRDTLPSFNLALWPIEDKLAVRYSIAKQRARPSLSQLTGTSVVTCYNLDEGSRAALEQQFRDNPALLDDGNAATDDETELSNTFGSFVDRCTGNIGNPALKGYEAITQNVTLEWYPNRDTQISISAYEIAVETGRPQGQGNVEGFIVEDNPYVVNTYADGEGGLKTRGVEFAARTAFTFLPSFLRHTGGGFNMSTSKSSGGTTENLEFDIVTGQLLPPKKESSYYYNANLWYDDGRINARVAYQTRDVYFQDLSFAGLNRVGPPDGSTASYYKIGAPWFRSKTNSLDARASYKLNENVQFFVEGKNLLDDTQYNFVPTQYRDIGDDTTLRYDNTYVGRKYYVGLIYTF